VGSPSFNAMKTFAPPLSGPMLGHIIDAFDLRRLDHGDVLTKRNSRRYLAGERVSPDAVTEAQRAVAEAIVEAGLLPPRLTLLDLMPLPDGAPAAELAKAPLSPVVAHVIDRLATAWDTLAGALRRLSAPVAFPRLAAGACLRLVTIDIAVRLTALLWLSGNTEDAPIPDFWIQERSTGPWLRTLHDACSPSISRDKLAERVRVHPHTLDGWLDSDVRPTDENLMDLAHAFAEHGVGLHEQLLHRLRVAFGARALFKKVEDAVGKGQAADMGARFVRYANHLLGFPRVSQKSKAENDYKMKVAFALGTLARGQLALPWVEAMLHNLWRFEPDPVWRTSLKAATQSWFEHLQQITAKLGSSDESDLLAVFGEVPDPETMERIGYMVQASKEEQARDPMLAAAMANEARQGGRYGALELKLMAGEVSHRGATIEAINLLRAAVEKDPLNAEIHFRLGCNLWQIGDIKAALEELEISVQIDPDWDRSRVEIGIVLLNEHRDEEALKRLEESKRALSAPSSRAMKRC
jgi:tetratricopeptide (TPR) repeat protein